jgi:hypothetical protein
MGAVETQEFMRRTLDLLGYVMPKYEREGKSYLTMAIGCTGGRHRSVVIADAIARELGNAGRSSMNVVHRDVDRGGVERHSDLELKGAATAPPSITPAPTGTRGGVR